MPAVADWDFSGGKDKAVTETPWAYIRMWMQLSRSVSGCMHKPKLQGAPHVLLLVLAHVSLLRARSIC